MRQIVTIASVYFYIHHTFTFLMYVLSICTVFFYAFLRIMLGTPSLPPRNVAACQHFHIAGVHMQHLDGLLACHCGFSCSRIGRLLSNRSGTPQNHMVQQIRVRVDAVWFLETELNSDVF